MIVCPLFSNTEMKPGELLVGTCGLDQIEMMPARPGAERVGSSMERLVIIQVKNTRILSEGEGEGFGEAEVAFGDKCPKGK